MKPVITWLLVIVFCAVCVPLQALGYGPQGHALVGAIAEYHVTKNAPAIADKISEIIDGISLNDAAVMPDTIKTWDKFPGDTLFADHPSIESDLMQFWQKNHHMIGSEPLHHVFHYTDVPIAG